MRQGFSLMLLALLPALSQPRAVAAQVEESELRVRLETSDGRRLSGALVALLGSDRQVISEGVSTESGMRLFRATPGSYLIRVRRIGFLPFVSAPVSHPASGEIVLRVESPRVQLQTVTVTSRSRCGAIEGSEQKLGVLWDEIAKALRTSQLTSRDFAGVGRAFVYRRRLGPGGNVIWSDTSFRPLQSGKAFGMVDPAALAASGYVFGNARHGWTYYGPDEAVLLSDHFAATHCFRAVRERDRPSQIGIEFRPVKGRPVPDIAGVLWVDEATAELRELVFRFVNAGVLDRFQAGGVTRFRRVPSGAFIVDDWRLRGPALEATDGTFGQLKLVGYVEDGGGVKAGGAPPPPP